MTTNDIQTLLTKAKLFEVLTPEQIAIIAQAAEAVEYKEGDYLFKEHNTRHFVFIIKQGNIDLVKQTPFGKEKRLASFSDEDFLGEGCLIEDSPHSTSALVVDNSTVIRIRKEAIQQHADILLKLLPVIARLISRRIRQSNANVVNAGAQYLSGKTRTEHDLLGDREVPSEYYYGVQTLRALENFNISGISLSFHPELVESLAMVKLAAARANEELGILPSHIADAIVRASRDIIKGRFHNHFVVDMIQGGAGTSTNMNANEVIANRALEFLGYEKGDYQHCHPNNHVNLSQSTNDVYPTAAKIALVFATKKLEEALRELLDAFRAKAQEFRHIIKMGRTQLQDAVPMTLGQEFEAFAVTLEEEIERIPRAIDLLLDINMGGTAIGTGINADPKYKDLVLKHLIETTGLPLRIAKNLVEATQDTSAFVSYASSLKRIAVKVSKICNDLRLLSSGPRAGLAEIRLPAMQPGSSIMPGKVNPVIPEVVNQVAFKVIANDLTVTLAAEAGQLQLNVMEPVMIQSLFESVEMLKNAFRTLTHRCIVGIEANEEKCRSYVRNSISIVTALNPVLGYEVCSQLSKEALAQDLSVYDLVIQKNLLSKQQLDELLSPENMIGSM